MCVDLFWKSRSYCCQYLVLLSRVRTSNQQYCKSHSKASSISSWLRLHANQYPLLLDLGCLLVLLFLDFLEDRFDKGELVGGGGGASLSKMLA